MAKATSNAKTIRTFYNAEGKPSNRAQKDTVRMTCEFVEEGKTLDMDWDNVQSGVQNASGCFGAMTSVTNAAGGHHPTMSPFERACERWGTIREDGEWQGEREGGPQTGLVVEAAVSFGHDRENLLRKLKDESITVATLMQNKAIAAKVLELRALKAVDRAKQAKSGADDQAELAELLA